MGSHPVRVAHILWSGYLGGAERTVFDLVTGLPSTDFVSHVVFLNKVESLAIPLKKAGIPYFEVGMKTGFSFLRVKKLVTVLRNGNFDIIHEHIGTKWSRLFLGLFFPRAILFYTIHNSKFPQMFTWREMLLEKASRSTVQRYIAVSDAIKREYVDLVNIPEQNITTIPNFVDISRFDSFTEKDRSAVRETLGLSANDTMLLSIGRLVQQKAFDRLIGLCLPVMREKENIRLFIAGRGPLENMLREIIAQNGLTDKVLLLGERQDIPNLLTACDIFVFAPLFESFGIVVAEAMAAGKPVVTVKIPAIDEIITNYEDGIMIALDDNVNNAFPSAIRRLIDNPDIRNKMGSLAIEKVRKTFSRDIVINKIVLEYRKVLHC